MKYRIEVLSKNRQKGHQTFQVDVEHEDDAINRAKQMYGDDYIWEGAFVNEVPPASEAVKLAAHKKMLYEANLLTAQEYVAELNKIRQAQGLPPFSAEFNPDETVPDVLK